jgi:hypothetical protein
MSRTHSRHDQQAIREAFLLNVSGATPETTRGTRVLHLQISMAMAATAATMSAAIPGRSFIAAGIGRGKDGKFLGQLFGTAVRALGSLPIAGAHQYLAVAGALLTMKFVNRHGNRIIGGEKISSGKRSKISPFLSTAND